MNLLRQRTALLLLQVFLILAAPKELLHEIFHGKESTDFICEEGCGNHISSQHEHCEELQLSSPPLYFSLSHFSFKVCGVLRTLAIEDHSAYHFSTSAFLFFRGPPVLS